MIISLDCLIDRHYGWAQYWPHAVLFPRLAYVVYADKEEADSVLAMYKGKKIILDGRRLFVMKYFNPEKSVIPEGNSLYCYVFTSMSQY